MFYWLVEIYHVFTLCVGKCFFKMNSNTSCSFIITVCVLQFITRNVNVFYNFWLSFNHVSHMVIKSNWYSLSITWNSSTIELKHWVLGFAILVWLWFWSNISRYGSKSCKSLDCWICCSYYCWSNYTELFNEFSIEW